MHTLRPQHLQRYNFTGFNYSGLQRFLFSLTESQISHTLLQGLQIRINTHFYSNWLHGQSTIGGFFYFFRLITMILFSFQCWVSFHAAPWNSFYTLTSLQISSLDSACVGAFIMHFCPSFTVADISFSLPSSCFVWLVFCNHPRRFLESDSHTFLCREPWVSPRRLLNNDPSVSNTSTELKVEKERCWVLHISLIVSSSPQKRTLGF